MQPKIKIVIIVSIFMLLGFSTAFGQGDWEFDCLGNNFFSWQSELSDSAGNPLVAGDYSLEYCFYEDSAATMLIGCCSTTITIPVAKLLFSGAAASRRVFSTKFAYPVPILEDVVKRRGMAALAFPEIWLELNLEGEVMEPTIKIYSVPFAGVAQRVNGDIVTQPGKITVLSPAPDDSARIVLSADSTGASIDLYNSAGELKISMTSEDSTVTFGVPVIINSNLDVMGNIAVSGTVDGVNISSFKADYDNQQSKYFQFGGLNHDSVTVSSSWTKLITTGGTHSFTKSLNDTKIEVNVNSRFTIGTLSGNGVLFQVRVDGDIPDFDNQGAIRTSNTTEFLSLFAVIENLPAGSHTVSIWARAPSGSASSVHVDSGGWGGKIVVKETR